VIFFCFFLFVMLSNDKGCDNGNAIRLSTVGLIVKTIMVSLHRGRFVVVHLYSSFPIDPQNFPRGANFYQKLQFLAIFGTVRPQF